MFAATRMGLMAKKGGLPEVMGTSTSAPAASINTEIELPADIQVGELLLAFVSGPTSVTTEITTSSPGWSRVTSAIQGSAVIGSLFKKIATESNALVVSTGTGSRVKDAVCYRIKNATTCEGTSSSGLTASYAAGQPTLNLSQPRTFLGLAVVSLYGAVNQTGTPSGYTNVVETTPTVSRMAVHASRCAVATADSSSPGSWGVASNSIRFVTITAAVY